ncbi:DUF2510 domain-containing protein [Thermomonospora umbrina]|uniref:Uncharacterized protein DUF2510 n=1 Tax=Thermomonospora umbrina TaxID=111806 RepID=A0A3D9SJD4_9ACTN|nr:DUF2510 domain-containing protein [Thermomonospora umbrina]REE95817.1 uncharacterized protein DUF2510 [Thermomonospora umbrina]
MSGQTPAGWYHDPYGTPGLLRYWDGGQWTQATQPTDEWEDAETTQGGAGSSSPPPPAATPPSSPSGAPQIIAPPAAGGGQPGPSTPPPWTPTPEAQPAWNWEGVPPSPQTPQPWRSPVGPQTPQPWQPPPAPPARGGNGMLWALSGGGVVIVALIVVVALFASGVFEEDPRPLPTAAPSPGTAAPSVRATVKSPVTGTLQDTASGVSYAQLGAPWRPQTVDPNGRFATTYGFSRGQIAVVQNDYNGQSEYLASVYSGRLPSSVEYGGPEDLASAVTAFAKTIETEPEPNGSYPSHTREDLEADDLEISDHKAYFTKFRLDFPQAQARGWNFRSETVTFVLIDQGSGTRPSVVWITIPDSHPNGGDLDQLFESIKVP